MYIRESVQSILKQFHESADYQNQVDNQEDLGSMREGFQTGIYKNQQGQQGKAVDVSNIPDCLVSPWRVIVRAAEEEQNRQQGECGNQQWPVFVKYNGETLSDLVLERVLR